MHAIKQVAPDLFVFVDAQGNELSRRWYGPTAILRSQQRLMAQIAKSRPQPAAARPEKLEPLELQDYIDFVRERLRPRLNLRSRKISIDGVEESDEGFESVHLVLAQQGRKANKSNLHDAIRLVASENRFDPVREYLNEKAVDQKTALTGQEWSAIAALALGVEGEFEGEVLRKFLISAVARVFEPGCKVDQALVLYGRQGLGKSTFFRILAGDWFTDSMGDDTSNKDEVAKLHAAWIAEWSELDRVFGGAQKAEQVKRFVSAQDDLMRVPYGRNTDRYARQSVLVGTTNRDDWASDHTGNRRYPVLAPQAINRDWLTANRDRIWARAVAEYRKGTPWWYSAEQEDQISERARAYAPDDEWSAVLEAFWKGKEEEWYTVKELAVMALATDPERFDRKLGARIRRSMQATFATRLATDRRAHSPRKASCGPHGAYACLTVLRSK